MCPVPYDREINPRVHQCKPSCRGDTFSLPFSLKNSVKPVAFQDPRSHSMTAQAWKMIVRNFMTFQVFHDLCQPGSGLLSFLQPRYTFDAHATKS